jgi:hypothetical protein
MLRSDTLVRTNVSEGCIASIFRVTRFEELRKMLTGTSNFLHSEFQLIVTANIVPSSKILSNLKMEAICSSKTFVFTRATRRYILEDGILDGHRLKSSKLT